MYPPGGAGVSFRVRVYCWRGQDVLEPGGHVSRGQQKTHIKRDLGLNRKYLLLTNGRQWEAPQAWHPRGLADSELTKIMSSHLF